MLGDAGTEFKVVLGVKGVKALKWRKLHMQRPEAGERHGE